jgi:hypothetical protein
VRTYGSARIDYGNITSDNGAPSGASAGVKIPVGAVAAWIFLPDDGTLTPYFYDPTTSAWVIGEAKTVSAASGRVFRLLVPPPSRQSPNDRLYLRLAPSGAGGDVTIAWEGQA